MSTPSKAHGGNAVLVKKFFGMTTQEMKREYMALTAEEKQWFADQIRELIDDGTFSLQRR